VRHAEDQRCETEEAGANLHNRKRNDYADYGTTYVQRTGPQAKPAVHLGVDIDPGVTLTPAEARRLGRSLLRLARLARMPSLETSKGVH
jgi:hypothetical protein